MNDTTVNLADRINQAFEDSVALAKEVNAQATTAIEKAVECGRLMLEQKEVLLRQTDRKKKCGWLDWLDDNCPKISEQTARRYMGLAKLSGRNALPDSTGLRRAYLATGIWKEKKKEKIPPGPETPWVRYCKGLDAFRLWYHNRCEQGPMETWGEDALRLLSKELQWFVNLYNTIQALRKRLAAAEAEVDAEEKR